MIAIDTNLLIYAHRSSVPEHSRAREAIERAACDPRGWGIALGTIVEFWSVVTHSSIRGRPSTAKEALGFIESMVVTGNAEIWMPGPGFAQRLMQAAAALKVSGPRIFDLQIALTAFENGAHELWTNDSHFQAVPGLQVKNPIVI
jgi:toxin-antitoxin system PIN domain toxin